MVDPAPSRIDCPRSSRGNRGGERRTAGPPVGAPDQALEGFCRKAGVDKADLEVRESASLGKMLLVATESTYSDHEGRPVIVQRGQVIYY